jgi:hypothetical protein
VILNVPLPMVASGFAKVAGTVREVMHMAY